MADNPKHGDEIIVQQRGSLGKIKLVANRQLQQFFDELGTIVNEFTSVDDIVQQLTVVDSQNSKLKGNISRLASTTEDNGQQIAAIDAFLMSVAVRVRILSSSINGVIQLADDNGQNIAVIDGSLLSVIAKERALSIRTDSLSTQVTILSDDLDTLSDEVDTLTSRTDDLEQLIHVN